MIYDKLYPWQKKLIDKFKEKKSYGIWLDCGLGKTPVGLALAEANNCDKIIIITINSKATESVDLKGSWLWWANQSKFNYTMFDKSIFKPTKKNPFNGFTDNPEVLILNYESLYSRSKDKKEKIKLKSEIESFITNCKGHNVAILLDESHKVKDLQSLQTGAIIKIQKLCNLKANNTFTYLLTGTPFTCGFIDLYAQLKILGAPQTKAEFIDKFCIRGHIPGFLEWQQPIVGYKNTELLYQLVHRFAITINSEDVENLPEKVFVDHVLPQSNSFKLIVSEKLKSEEITSELNSRSISYDPTLYNNIKKKLNNPFYRNLAYPDTKWLADSTGSFWLRAREASIGFQGNAEEFVWYDKSRLNQLKDFLETNENNYIIFYNYTPELLEIADICMDLGYNVDIYSGEIKSMDYYDRYENQTSDQRITNKKNVIIANFASGSTGKNWQLYNQCIVFSIPVYKDWAQGIKRIHRLGQKDTCVYHLFYQDNVIDKGMTESLLSSTEYTKELFERDLKRINELHS